MSTEAARGSAPEAMPVPESFCVRRGTEWLHDQDELTAHLAYLLRLDNVGVLLGAGASMGPLGGMTMVGLWKSFEATYTQSCQWLRDNEFVSTDPPDVEQLADALQIAALEWERVSSKRLPELVGAQADLHRSIIRAALLKQEWWSSPESMDAATELNDHRRLLKKLTSARQPGQASPWVFTTNYDLAVEWAAETIGLHVSNGFDGIHRRVFTPHNFDLGLRNVQARGEARFGAYNIYVAKLHGSLAWHVGSDESVLETPAWARWSTIKSFLAGNGSNIPGLLVLPNAAKYVHTVGFLLGELFRRFTDFVSRPQACLIVNGYSFSDEHLNRLLLSALQNPTMQVVIYAREAERVGDALDVSRCRTWLQRVASLQSPQVTIVGGRDAATFAALVGDLPDPAIYNEEAAVLRDRIRKLSSGHAGGA